MKKLPKWATTVTPLSKAIALIIFITFPIIGFCIGRMYQLNLDQTLLKPSTELANPASIFCEVQGGKSKIVIAKDGSQKGECLFRDGRRCDEWQFFRFKSCK